MNKDATLNFIIKRSAEPTAAPADQDPYSPSPETPYSPSPAVPYTSAAPTGATTSFVTAPNTGENLKADFFGATKPSANFLPIAFIVSTVVLVAAFVYRLKKSHRSFDRGNFHFTRSPLTLPLSTMCILVAAFLASSFFSQNYVDSDLDTSSASNLTLLVGGTIDTNVDKYLDVKDLAYVSVVMGMVVTNSDYDYHISMHAETDKLYLNGDKNSPYYFNPTEPNERLDTHDNTWGYNTIQDYGTRYCNEDISIFGGALSGCDTTRFMPVPTADEKIFEGNKNATFYTFFAVNPGDDLPDGTYTTKVIYTAVSDEPATPERTDSVMQNWSGCPKMKIGETMSLIDTRDNKPYRVRKLVDGKCWMIDDLAFIKDMTLTPADSNVNSNVSMTFEKDAISDYDTDENVRYFEKNGDIFYNYYAATAKGAHMGDGALEQYRLVDTSICPVGWRLPTGVRVGDSEFELLAQAVGEDYYGYFVSPNGANFKWSGFYYNDGSYDDGFGRSYWSSVHSEYRAEELHVFDDFINITCTWNKDMSVSVRCIQGPIPPDNDPSTEEPDQGQEDPEEPDTDPTPSTNPETDCVITSSNPCALKDGNTWIIGNGGNTLTWNSMFNGNGTEGHEGSLKAGCPSGYIAPKITDYDNLIQAYGGTKITEVNNGERAGYRLSGDPTLFKIFGGKNETGNKAFWSSTERSSSDAYYVSMLHDYGGAYSAPSHAKNTDYYYAACFKATN